jgi:hypothetical protein
VSVPAEPAPNPSEGRKAAQGNDLPRRYRIDLPQALLDLSAVQRRRRARWTADDAVLDSCRFFARGELLIPVQGEIEPVCYDCWVEFGEGGHLVLTSTVEEDDRESLAPLPAQLANCLPPFYDTMGLDSLLVIQPPGHRPRIVVSGANRLANIQQEGLTPSEFQALAIDVLNAHQGAFANLSR